MKIGFEESVQRMAHEICQTLDGCRPSIYLYGSAVLDDFHLGWSDIDLLVLTQAQISADQALRLVTLRQTMLQREPDNPYYRSFEGGMLRLEAFRFQHADRVVYWGTSGQRIADRYHFDSFSMEELMGNGILLCGEDVRGQLSFPTFTELYADVKTHYEAIRKYAQQTDRSLYSFGWMLDIARCIYTLRTGKIIAKTEAGVWALENGLCPDPEVLELVLQVRRAPLQYREKREVMDYAEAMAEPIQRFAEVLNRELENTCV